MSYGRFVIILICIAAPLSARLQAQSQPLLVEREGDHLHISAPQLHFLEGKPLEQLHNGASVTYALELTMAPDLNSAPVLRLEERFILSFDLWEEKFAVVRAGPGGRTASHLTAAAAEAWCLDNLQIVLSSVSPDKPFVLKLECRTAGSESGSGNGNNSTLTLAGLVDVFSRKSHSPPPRWLAVSGPLRLTELKERKPPKHSHGLPGFHKVNPFAKPVAGHV